MAAMGNMVTLTGLVPFASGGRQLVFEHPENPSLAIKVLRPEVIPGNGSALWSRLAARYYYAISFMRVWREFERLRRKGGGSFSGFVQRVVGLVETDLGPGLVVEAERGGDGEYACTLRKLAMRGKIDGATRAALDQFCHEVEAADVVVSDLNPSNVVYATSPAGGSRFVLIDGTGDNTLVPILRLSKTLNRITKKRKLANLRGKVERIVTASAAARQHGRSMEGG